MDMDYKEQAQKCFANGFSCSQAVLSSFAPLFDLDKEMALKVASAFGGGMGSMGETCGAVTGAFMVLGLKYGKVKVEDRVSKGRTYKLVQEFSEKFQAKHGSLRCKELLGCDLSTPEGTKEAKERKLFTTICPIFVGDAVDLVAEILQKNCKGDE